VTLIARLVPVLGLLAAAGLLPGCGGSGDPEVERINRLGQQKNVAALEREIDAKDPEVGCQAVRALGQLGPLARPQVERAMTNPRAEVRREAMAVYPRVYSGPTAPLLATAARTDPDPTVRAVAVTALGRMRALDEIEALLAAAQEADPGVRGRASDAIAVIMGGRFDFSGTEADRSQTAAEVRRAWHDQSEFLRQYYQAAPAKPPTPPRPTAP